MSEDDVDLVREHVEAFNAVGGIDRFAARFKGSFAEYDYEMTEYPR